MNSEELQTNKVRRWKRNTSFNASPMDWLPEVPKHWDVKRLKWTVTLCQNGLWGDEPCGDNHDIPCVRVADFDRRRFVVDESRSLTIRSITGAQRSDRILQRGNLLLEKSGGGDLQPVGVVVMYGSDRPAVCSNFVARMPVAQGYLPDFLRYLHAAMYSARVNTRSIKQSIGIQNLDSHAYLQEQIALPPLSEQGAIAAFLDHETARIDALIGHKERLIGLLEEKRQAVISHIVAGQSNYPDVRLKYYVDILPGFAFPSDNFSAEPDDVRLLRGTNVVPGATDWSEVVYWPKNDTARYRDYELQAGDLIFGMDRPWIKSGVRVSRISQSDLPCLLLQRVARIRAKEGLRQIYLELLLSSAQFAAYFEPILTGVSVPHISTDQILGFRFGLPTQAEQSLKCHQVGEQFAALCRTKARIHDGIAHLQEYRGALISAAVTGQIDVRDEVAQ